MTETRHRQSAGPQLFRRDPDALRVLIAHMGGPLWAKKDDRVAWMTAEEARPRLVAAQDVFIERLVEALAAGG